MALKFEVGDIVRVVDNIHGHGFKIGKDVLIEAHRNDGVYEYYQASRIYGSEDEWWHISDSEIESTE